MNLYLRRLWLLVRLPFVRRAGLLAPSRLTLRVWPTDCDLNRPPMEQAMTRRTPRRARLRQARARGGLARVSKREAK